jgi:Helix-turn-helix domain
MPFSAFWPASQPISDCLDRRTPSTIFGQPTTRLMREPWERTQAGLKAARAQGRHGGRQPKFTQAQRAEILNMLAAGRPAAEVARLFQVHRATISRINAASRQTTAA